MSFGSFSYNIWEGVDIEVFSAAFEAELADYFARESGARPNDFSVTSQSVVNTVNVAIAPPIPTVDNLQPTIEYAQAIAAESVAEFGTQETPLVVTLLETLDDAGDLAGYLVRKVPAFWFGNIQVIMNGLTDAQRTTINSLDIGSQLSVTKSFPNSTPSTVTQIMALEGISHDITPDRHIVTLYPNPLRIYTHFIVGGYTTTTTRTNLVTNPNFETNVLLTENTSPAGSSIARSTAEFYSGTASCAGTTAATAGNLIFGTSATSNRLTVVGSQSYTASLAVKSATVTRTARIRIVWYNSAGASITVSDGANQTTSISAWQVRSVTGTAPALAVTAIVQLVVLSAGTTETHYLDAIMLETGSTLLPYFDGTYADTYTGYTLTAQAWNGTANASTSTATWGLTSSFVGSELSDDTKGLA
jgi:hypothetical protein